MVYVRRMKILLIYPYFLEERLHVEDIAAVPIGLYSVAAVLRESGHEVEILNWHAVQDAPEAVENCLREKKADVLGFSIFHANRWGGIDIARRAKAIDPRVTVVFGGIGATFLWEHLLANFAAIDYVVLGEGEFTLRELLDHLARGRPPAPEDIPGLAWRRSGRPVRNGDRKPIDDLDRLPVPAAHFSYPHLALTRGCPADCSFCGSPAFWGRRVRFRSAGHFLTELEALYAKGVAFFHFCDDTFTLGKDLVIEVCRGILQRGLRISWAAISRVDLVDEEVIAWMRRAGCIQVSYGVESGSEEIRRALNKRIRVAQVRKAFALTQGYGIMARAYFIYGCPGESRQTIQATVDLMEEIKPLGAIFYLLALFPGTALYESYRKRQGVGDEIWLRRVEDLLYFETDPRLTREGVLAFGRRLRSAFHEGLPRYVDAVELVDRREFFPLHADFCSRLGMTFDHGEYAALAAVQGKPEIAARLYRRALSYHPDARAFVGLAIHLQKAGDYDGSLRLLGEGLGHFPADPQLNLCAAVSRLNLGDPRGALGHLLPFQRAEAAVRMMADCYRALGKPGAAAELEKRLKSPEPRNNA